MTLNPRAIALQGIEFTPLHIAVQGLSDDTRVNDEFRRRRRRVATPKENDEALLLLIL